MEEYLEIQKHEQFKQLCIASKDKRDIMFLIF